MILSRRAVLGAGVALASGIGSRAGASEPEVTIRLSPAFDRPGPSFEGWGTALAWFANVSGTWPEAVRQRLADLLYGAGGLGWTIGRYNIGGGARPGAEPGLRTGAAVEGFWRQPQGMTGDAWWRADNEAMWNWSADAGQRWWLDAIKVRVPQPILEAFSNSPPWFMTVSGKVSGAEKPLDDNLRRGYEVHFAAYLARVVDELQRRHGVVFRTLSPVNEPNTDYWYAGNRQEGAHWSPARQAAMFIAADAALKARSLSTTIAGPDETNSSLFLRDWAQYPPAAKRVLSQLNVHSYGTVNQTGVRDIARASGLRLWMSENDTPMDKDPENFDSVESALALAEHIVLDLKRLEPEAWVFWQAVEDISTRKGEAGSNWGLIKADFSRPPTDPRDLHVTSKYWAMAQFSRFIRPGHNLIFVDDIDTVGALSPDRRELVLVHVNSGLVTRRLSVPRDWAGLAMVSDARRRAEPSAQLVAPPRSVTTLLLRKAQR